MKKIYEMFAALIEILAELKGLLYKENFARNGFLNDDILQAVIMRKYELPGECSFEEFVKYASQLLKEQKKRLLDMRAEYAADKEKSELYKALMEYGIYSDWECYGYRGNFPNEAPLPAVCEKMLDEAIARYMPAPKKEAYLVSIYDMSNYDIVFGSEKDAEAFIDSYGDTCTLFKNKGTYFTEVYSV